MVLYDPGIREQHCLLEKQPDGWLISVLDGPVSDSEGHAAAQSLWLPPGTPFAAGGIWLCVVSADTPGRMRRRKRRRMTTWPPTIP